MDDDDKLRLARQGLELLKAADPSTLKERFEETAKETAEDALLSGAEALGLIPAGRTDAMARSPALSAASPPPDLDPAFGAMGRHSLDSFDARLEAARAQAKPAAPKEVVSRERPQADSADLRRSFPEASKELAVLVFSCVDLLEDLSAVAAGQKAIAAEDLQRRERLLEKIAVLLAPRAGEALASFVGHVVELSRRARSAAR